MPETLSEEQLNEALLGIKIPPQPQILVDITMEQVSPDPSLKHISDLIRQDMGLSGAILKVVNSPYFGLSNNIVSVEHAVSILGLNSVINIINGLALKSELSDETIIEMNRFWDHASDIALISATIAKETGYPSADEAYLLGLFHACGMPLMMTRYPEYPKVVAEAYSGKYERIIDLENERFNTNHAVLGYYTAKSWNLPQHICQLIGEQYNLKAIRQWQENYDGHRKTLLAILKIAMEIGDSHRKLGGPNAKNVEWETYSEDILEFMGLSVYDFENIKSNVREFSS
ncbi:MAG: HDOD domain-containing protein [Gammaproteobacteria bacterium]|nr:HDOD domain-containing protein [Gammaproteobacteria bacterium]